MVQSLNDSQLLARYVGKRSDEAFRTLVDRHLAMVYAVCRRQLRDPHWAEDVCQAVFILLAKKADQLKPGVVLGGWLYRTAIFACSNARDLKRTRTFHENRVVLPMNRFERSPLAPENPLEQAELESLLDEGLMALSAMQREVIIQRFFESKPLEEIARAQGKTKYATEKALSSGLAKFRRFLSQRGLTISGALLAMFLAEQAARAVPVGLAATVTATAVGAGSAVSASVGVLVAHLLKAGTQAKLVAAMGAAVGCVLMASIVFAFGNTGGGRVPAAGGGGTVVATALARPATAVEVEALLATLRCAEAALRRMDTGEIANVVAFSDARQALQWEKMSRLFEADVTLKKLAVARFGAVGETLTATPTFAGRLDEILPAIDPASADFKILDNRAVCRFAYQRADTAGGAVYFLWTDAGWRIDVGTTLNILLEGTTPGAGARLPLDLLEMDAQRAVLDRMDRLELAFRQVALRIATGELASLDDARTALQGLDSGTGARAFFSLALRRDQFEQPRY